ncbi:LysR family transcriptional regulator [Pseudomonas sp. C9-3]|uniref:LysR family transcriptional regulator n=1 Tax=Pseudomonas sp. C9-3 TaxID=3078264 RepID=UPI0028E9031B|nr:LysR family transcriptional regulator [Pseudomonas sp. C9-3]
MDKLNSLQLFVISAELGSFSRAAEELGKTPSAVAKSVGQLYLETAREVLERMRESEEEIAQLHHSLKGRLRINGPLAFGRPFLNGACASFLQKHPDMRLQVDLSDAYIDMLDGRYDLALRLGHSDLPGLIAQPVGASRIVFCASPDYLQRHGEPQRPEQLVEYECLVYRHPALGDSWLIERGGERVLLPRNGRLNSDNQELLLEACLAGQGILPSPYWSVLPYLRDGRLRTILDDCHFDPKALGSELLAVYPSTRRATRKIIAFIEHLRDYLREQRLV